MNLVFQICDENISVKVPAEMKKLVKKNAKRLKITSSIYIKLAIQEKLEKEKYK